MSPSNIIFSVFSCLGFLACMIPLPWHLQGELHALLIKESNQIYSVERWNLCTNALGWPRLSKLLYQRYTMER